jgi:ribonucleotide monophosphatase NagD (HAD superfamily)
VAQAEAAICDGFPSFIRKYPLKHLNIIQPNAGNKIEYHRLTGIGVLSTDISRIIFANLHHPGKRVTKEYPTFDAGAFAAMCEQTTGTPPPNTNLEEIASLQRADLTT